MLMQSKGDQKADGERGSTKLNKRSRIVEEWKKIRKEAYVLLKAKEEKTSMIPAINGLEHEQGFKTMAETN